MKINAVFEGGGVKGIGLAGAVAAVEQLGYEFNQVAGTSSGSIVASLVAAGYRAGELKEVIEGTPFRSFLHRAPVFNLKWVGPLTRLFVKQGLYSGDRLEHWIYQLLLAKGIRTFGDLEKDQLRIIASDISGRRLLVLPDDIAHYGFDPRRFLVAKAVRMSSAIPYFFDPVIIRKKASVRRPGESFTDGFIFIVDGALLSNFPLWIFDRMEASAAASRQIIPTIGFQLVGRGAGVPNRIRGPVTMMRALFSTMLDAHDERYIQEQNRFRTVKIPTLGVSVTDFDLTDRQSQELYDSGHRAALSFFQKWKLDEYKQHWTKFHPRADSPAGPGNHPAAEKPKAIVRV